MEREQLVKIFFAETLGREDNNSYWDFKEVEFLIHIAGNTSMMR